MAPVWVDGLDVQRYSAFDWRRKAVLGKLPYGYPSSCASSDCVLVCWLEGVVGTGIFGSMVEARLDQMTRHVPLVAGGRWLGRPASADVVVVHLGRMQRWVVVGIDGVCPIAWNEFQTHCSGFVGCHGW